MKIDDLLYELLLKKGHVVVPGFGIFTKEATEAYIHPVEHSFSPAGAKINFKLDKNARGEELLTLMTSTGKLSKQEAESIIKKTINEWVRSLKNRDAVHIQGLGQISLNSSGIVIFKVEQDSSFDIKWFGLQGFKAEPAGVKSPSAKATARQRAGSTAPEEKRSFLWAAIAAMILLLAVAGTWYFVRINPKPAPEPRLSTTPGHNADTTEAIAAQQPTPVDTLASATKDKTRDADSTPSLQPDTAMNDNTVMTQADEQKSRANTPQEQESGKQQTTVDKTQNHNRYYLIAGCFRDRNKAESYVDILRQRGFPASIQGTTSGGLIRVCYAGYPSLAEAKKAHRKVSAQENKAVWIQKIEK